MSAPAMQRRKYDWGWSKFLRRMDRSDLQAVRRVRSCRVYGTSYGHAQLIRNGRKP